MGKYLIAVATSDGVHVDTPLEKQSVLKYTKLQRMHIANWKRER